MADGVQQDHGLILLSKDMENQTDVGMGREDHGQMMSTECQVNTLNSSGPAQLFSIQLPQNSQNNPSPKGSIPNVLPHTLRMKASTLLLKRDVSSGLPIISSLL